MNFLLAGKLNKALEIVRKNGIFGGGRIVFPLLLDFFRMFFSWRGKGDVLFVVGGVGATSLYRGHNVAEELEVHGFKCKVVIQSNPFLKRFAKNFKIFVFHRMSHSPSVKSFVEEIKNQGKEIIFETDDLLHDPKYLKEIDYLENISDSEKKLYEKGLGSEILNDPYVRVCTTTTRFLKEKLEDLKKTVFLVPNKINNKELEWADALMREREKKENEGRIVRLGYFSGTMSHNKDFRTIVGVLEKVMEKHENVELFLAGPLEKQNRLIKFGDRIKIIPFSSRKDNYKNIVKMDVNLLPLEIGNSFCEAKSELKFFEAGILGVPTIASATRTLKEAISDGENGFLASNEEEWFLKLKKMVDDKNLREEIGKGAREKSLKRYTNKNSDNKEYYEFLKKRLESI